ncbi:MAG: hypothetical protein ABFR65_05420 [Pseudomonadota bacterium]
MNDFLNHKNFPAGSDEEARALADSLEKMLQTDYQQSFFKLFSDYKAILNDNNRKNEWTSVNDKLTTIFKCGKSVPVDGPMIGVSMSIQDSDYFRTTAKIFSKKRSAIANIEWMASMWNLSFANSGIWMGKTFEPVSRQTVESKCADNPLAVNAYNENSTRIGRNFFRDPHNPSLIQLAGIPALTELWHLKKRPMSIDTPGFDSLLLQRNLDKEKHVPYEYTGGYFLANPGTSSIPEMNDKAVYQLVYRWPGLGPVYPMTRLVDEIVQVDDGIYLGQLVMATKHYSLGNLKFSLFGEDIHKELGEPYRPGDEPSGFMSFLYSLVGKEHKENYYAYQNNGFFLMIDPEFAGQAYADDAFPQLRPHPGEMGFKELGYDKKSPFHEPGITAAVGAKDEKLGRIEDWVSGWRDNETLRQKFTTFCLEESPKEDDSDVREMLQDGESILQMLQRIQQEISAQSKYADHLKHFEKLNRLFRSGVAPKIRDGLFQGSGNGYNIRYNGLENRQWYADKEPLIGFDFYHGATLNLHWGFADSFRPEMHKKFEDSLLFPSSLAMLLHEQHTDPNIMNMAWANIGRFIFPWAGKSFEKVSGRKLSMLVDESDDLKKRYPERVRELENHTASWPHYNLVLKNEHHHWDQAGPFAEHLKSGSWDSGMSDSDKQFWENEASQHWVFGNNIQDSRILAADSMFRMLDMNYRTPEKEILELAEAGPSPFVRQGYIFLGVDDRESILPMNSATDKKKRVFQFHYRYPMIGGAAPIGTCLDELVEIAQGLYLGQLIYSTAPWVPFHSSVDPKAYKYQLFGYFLLLDNDWEYHRQAIKLDTLKG